MAELIDINSACYNVAPSEKIIINNHASTIIITSKGNTFVGSFIMNVGYGTDQSKIDVLSDTTNIIGVESNKAIIITKERWGNTVITNNDSKTHIIYVTTIL